jgi:hypothetical protein
MNYVRCPIHTLGAAGRPRHDTGLHAPQHPPVLRRARAALCRMRRRSGGPGGLDGIAAAHGGREGPAPRAAACAHHAAPAAGRRRGTALAVGGRRPCGSPLRAWPERWCGRGDARGSKGERIEGEAHEEGCRDCVGRCSRDFLATSGTSKRHHDSRAGDHAHEGAAGAWGAAMGLWRRRFGSDEFRCFRGCCIGSRLPRLNTALQQPSSRPAL